MSSRVAPAGRILIVDDEPSALSTLAELLREEGYAVEAAGNGAEALPKLEASRPDALITDLHMPGMDGLELMAKARALDPEVVVIVMTGHSAIDSAVTAMRQGAADYVAKPVNFDELLLVLRRELDRRALRAEAARLRERLAEKHRVSSMLGQSAAMQAVFETILQVAPSKASVLITGESGTGKELVAAAIHEHSPRAHGPFVKLHCAALAESLLESELFGHERGAFTGAIARRDGRFQQASGGTLFLDEIGEISPAIQVKLLRFLQEHQFERVGGNDTIKVDVRVVAATNRDLLSRVKQGHFREDLYYRLNVVTIEVPPLRSRPSDIALLAWHFVNKFAKENGKRIEGISDEALDRLKHYHWPGNVRELENAIERAVVVSRGKTIRPEDFATSIVPAPSADSMPPIPGSTLAQLERFAIFKTLEHTGGATSRAAELLGISPRKIQYKLREYSGNGVGSHADESGAEAAKGGADEEDDASREG